MEVAKVVMRMVVPGNMRMIPAMMVVMSMSVNVVRNGDRDESGRDGGAQQSRLGELLQPEGLGSTGEEHRNENQCH